MLLLSIIIPVYNVEKYLRKCLDSVIYPQLFGYEIVCINDGSTDSSLEILNEYEDRYPELVRVISTENNGLGGASNRGIKEARGKFIVFLDSDDYYTKNAVPEILSECNDDVDIAFFDFALINETGHVIKYTKGCNSKAETFTLKDYPQILFELPSRANKIFRRELFIENEIYFPKRVWFEDFRTTPKLYTKCKKMRYIGKGWYNYLQQESSITHDKNTERNLEIIDASEDLISYFKSAGLFEKYREELEYSIFYNELLTSTDRVNLIDRKSPVQGKLYEWFKANFPQYRRNTYFKKMSPKYKMIHFLIVTRQYIFLNLLLRANNVAKHK